MRCRRPDDPRGWDVGGCAAAVLLGYVAVAAFVFQWRHPWMTDNEFAVYGWRAVVFGTVEYREARPR